MDLNLGCHAQRLQRKFNHLPGSVAAVGGNTLVVRAESQHRHFSRTRRNSNNVEQLQRLVDSDQPMETVSPRRTYIEAEVDLGVGTDGGRHTDRL
jgi:hypothetical protein